jgi:hypothetical protein
MSEFEKLSIGLGGPGRAQHMTQTIEDAAQQVKSGT